MHLPIPVSGATPPRQVSEDTLIQGSSKYYIYHCTYVSDFMLHWLTFQRRFSPMPFGLNYWTVCEIMSHCLINTILGIVIATRECICNLKRCTCGAFMFLKHLFIYHVSLLWFTLVVADIENIFDLH